MCHFIQQRIFCEGCLKTPIHLAWLISFSESGETVSDHHSTSFTLRIAFASRRVPPSMPRGSSASNACKCSWPITAKIPTIAPKRCVFSAGGRGGSRIYIYIYIYIYIFVYTYIVFHRLHLELCYWHCPTLTRRREQVCFTTLLTTAMWRPASSWWSAARKKMWKTNTRRYLAG